MNPTPVKTVLYVPADTIIPARDTVPADLLAVVAFAVFVAAAILLVWQTGRDRRAARHLRKQSHAIGVAAVGMALRIEKTR